MRRLYDAAWRTIAALDVAAPAVEGEDAVARLRPGGLVVDAGSGAGGIDRVLASRFRQVVSVDLEVAQRFATKGAQGGAVARIAADLERGVPLADGSADAFVALDVIEHLVDPAAFLAEAARVVKPGGELLLSTVNARFIGHLAALASGRVPRSIDETGLLAGLPAPHHGHVSVLTRGVLARWLAACGFDAEQWDALAVVGGRLSRLVPRAARIELLAQGFRVLARRSSRAAPVRRAAQVSVIVVAHQAGPDLVSCLAALRELRGPVAVAEVLVVDNASSDGAVDDARARFPEIEVLRSETNRGFGAAVNLAAERARHARLWVLNPDVTPSPGALAALEAMFASDPTVAAAGGWLARPDGGAALSWVHFPSLRVLAAWRAARSGAQRTAGWLTPREGAAGGGPVGACLLLDRNAFLEVGGFDEGFFLYAEEIDLFERLAERGFRAVRAPYLVGTHREGGSTRHAPVSARAAWIESHRRLLRKHRRPLAAWAFERWVARDPSSGWPA